MFSLPYSSHKTSQVATFFKKKPQTYAHKQNKKKERKMVAEDLQPPLNYSADYDVNINININPNKHRSYEDHNEDNEEEEEETLSLCDLPIYSDSFKWDDDFSTRDHSSNSFETVDDEDDFFEFFSDEYLTTASNSVHKTDMIVFCGKLIPYRGTIAGQHQQQQQQYDVVAAPPAKQSDVAAAKRQQGVLGHYVKPSNDSEAVSSSSSRGFRVGMVKPRWYVYLFGMVRFPPAEMALRDMRTRQSRRRRSGSGSGSGRGEMKGETTKKKASSKSGRRGGLKGLWGLLRALGCRSRHVENVAKAAYGAVPRVSGA